MRQTVTTTFLPGDRVRFGSGLGYVMDEPLQPGDTRLVVSPESYPSGRILMDPSELTLDYRNPPAPSIASVLRYDD